jgi:hypothetical protein
METRGQTFWWSVVRHLKVVPLLPLSAILGGPENPAAAPNDAIHAAFLLPAALVCPAAASPRTRALLQI